MKQFILSFLFAFCITLFSKAQFNYTAANTQIIADAYTDLGTNGVPVTTNFDGNTMTYQDDNSSTQDIGFNFTFNGVVFTHFVLNTSGYIELGNTRPTVWYNSVDNVMNSPDNFIIAPFNLDLRAGASPEYRVFTSGTVGTRICTIQFKDLQDGAAAYGSINFQIRLYENSNNIEFVYGNFTLGGGQFYYSPVIGLKGISASKSVNAIKSYNQSWDETQFVDGFSVSNSFGNIVLPSTGTIFRFNCTQPAQFYNAATTILNTGVYTDLNNSGNTITSNFDGNPMTYNDDNSAIQDIGFNFIFNGSVFTKFVLNSNGFIKLGTSRPIPNNYDVINSNDSNTIAAFNYDLDGGSSPEYRVFTSGIAGSRICIIQFKNLREFNTPPQYNDINFQIKLYEGSNKIEFVYGDFIASAQAPSSTNVIVGVKANSSSASVNATKESTQSWSATQFINGAYTGNLLNNQNNFLPLSGTTFQFNVNTLQQEVKVDAVYTLGEIPIPFGTYNHIVKAKLINLGLTSLINLPVTLNITGANSFSTTKIVSLDPMDTLIVSFDPFSSSAQGINIITVSVPPDDDNTDNSSSYNQSVSDSSYNYADASASIGGRGFGTGAGRLLTKYTATGGSIKVTKVRVHISNDPANVGNTVTAVVVGNDSRYSDPYVIVNADLGNYKTFLINDPQDFANGSEFFVGLEQTVNASTAYYPVSYQNEGMISRPGAYYEADAPDFQRVEKTDLGRLMIEAVVSVGTITAFNIYNMAYSNGYSDLAIWDFTGLNSPVSAAATTYHQGLSSSNLLTRGPDAPPSPRTNAFTTAGFQNDGISTSNTDYFQFSLSPRQGDTLSLQFLNVPFLRTDSSFAIAPGVSYQFAYSLDGINFTLIESPLLGIVYNDSIVSGTYFSLGAIPDLQDIISGTTATFRFYASGQTTTGAFGFSSQGLLSVNGKIKGPAVYVDPVIPIGADFLLPTCSSTANGSISFTSVGTFNADNVYTAQLGYMKLTQFYGCSCSLYVFGDTVNVGTLASSANSGTINFTIPAGHQDGSTYAIRVLSSSPVSGVSTFTQPFAIQHAVVCSSPQDYFRSKQTGDWNNLSTWESRPLNSNTWVPAASIPNELAESVTINVTDTVTVTTPVNIRNVFVDGRIKLLNEGANNGALIFFNYQQNPRYNYYSMKIDSGGVLQVVSSAAVFEDVIRVSNSSWTNKLIEILVKGMITIGDGSSTNAEGMYEFATIGYARFLFRDASVFEWNSSSSFGPLSHAVYFVDDYWVQGLGSIGGGHPVFRLTIMPPGSFGGTDSTRINGILEVNTPVTMAGSGRKVFRDGVKGTSILTQATGSGEFRTINPYIIIPPSGDTTGTTIGIMDGTIHIGLSDQGFILENGITVTDSADVHVSSGITLSFQNVEVQPNGHLTIDSPGGGLMATNPSELNLENADLINRGTLDGPGVIKFTGNQVSHLNSPGIITAPILLINKEVVLTGNSNTASIDITNHSHLKLDSFHLNIGSAPLNADSVNFIVTNDTGRLIRNVAATEVKFPIGVDTSSYTPVTLTNSGIAGNLKVRVAPGVSYVQPPDNGIVDRTWFIDSTNGGSILLIKTQWNAGNEQGFDRLNSFIAQLHECNPPPNCDDGFYYDNAARTAALGTDPYTQSRNNITRPTSFIVKSVSDTSTFVNIAGNGNWNDPLNWRIGIVPSTTIANGKVIVIDYPNPQSSTPCSVIGDIIIEPGGQLIIRNNCILTVTGNIINH